MPQMQLDTLGPDSDDFVQLVSIPQMS